MNVSQCLYALISASVLETCPSIPQGEKLDWDSLMQEASNHGVLALVYDAIEKLPIEQQPPRASKVSWGLSAQEIWDRYNCHQQVLKHLLDLCSKNGIRVLLLKGVGLSNLYSKPESRPSGDIDIFLFNDFEKGNRLLAKGKTVFDKKHTEFEFEGVLVENHLTPLDTDTKQRRKVQSFITQSYSKAVLTQDGYYIFEPMAGLVYLISHTIRHFSIRTLVPFRSIIDIFMYLYHWQDSLDAEKLYNILCQLKLEKAFAGLLLMGEEMLGKKLPQYHFDTLSARDVNLVKELIWGGFFSFPDTQSLTFLALVRMYVYRYCKLHRAVHWFNFSRLTCFNDMFRLITNIALKRLLGKPDNQWLFGKKISYEI